MLWKTGAASPCQGGWPVSDRFQALSLFCTQLYNLIILSLSWSRGFFCLFGFFCFFFFPVQAFPHGEARGILPLLPSAPRQLARTPCAEIPLWKSRCSTPGLCGCFPVLSSPTPHCGLGFGVFSACPSRPRTSLLNSVLV